MKYMKTLHGLCDFRTGKDKGWPGLAVQHKCQETARHVGSIHSWWSQQVPTWTLMVPNLAAHQAHWRSF